MTMKEGEVVGNMQQVGTVWYDSECKTNMA